MKYRILRYTYLCVVTHERPRKCSTITSFIHRSRQVKNREQQADLWSRHGNTGQVYGGKIAGQVQEKSKRLIIHRNIGNAGTEITSSTSWH